MMAKERTLIQGKTVEEKLASAEILFQQFQRRLGTKVVGIVPPIPILANIAAPAEDGVVFRGISPLDGTVVKFCMAVAQIADKSFTYHIIIERPDGSNYSVSRVMQEKLVVMNTDYPISAGEILQVSVLPADSVTGIVIGILIHPDMRQVATEHYLLDRLLELETRIDRDLEAKTDA